MSFFMEKEKTEKAEPLPRIINFEQKAQGAEELKGTLKICTHLRVFEVSFFHFIQV